jgi:hypothetical protein
MVLAITKTTKPPINLCLMLFRTLISQNVNYTSPAEETLKFRTADTVKKEPVTTTTELGLEFVFAQAPK